ncbi:MAG: hypothetical protein KAH10_00650 [Flavobacteriales bacterium]|nr:hypothetical protein [Flavobacteriales bacterium]
MKRIIVDFKKMSGKIKRLFRTQYPDGYDTRDLIEFRNHRNELIKAVEVKDKDKDTTFLVKLATTQGISVDKLNTRAK